jgi:hypothetical protein
VGIVWQIHGKRIIHVDACHRLCPTIPAPAGDFSFHQDNPMMKSTFDDCLRDLAERFEATQEQQNAAAWRAFTHPNPRET